MTYPNTPEKLSLLWIFLILNYLFCDVFSLFSPETIQGLNSGNLNGLEMSGMFLMIFSVIMSLPIFMVVASRLLPQTPNRIANIVIAVAMIVVQVGSLVTPGSMPHYWYFSVIEIVTLLWIGAIAWGWRERVAAGLGATA